MLTSNVLIGNHPKFVKAMELANNIAVTKAPVLVTGETGTGKKTLCRFIHTNSARKDAPFLFVDCSQEGQQVENEILGYRDAEGRFNKGILEQANGGTVVFVNIDALNESFQKRLHQILNELPDYELDVRIMATTTKNLSKYVGAGRFHRALYTVFSGSQIPLIPLRERESDIIEIAEALAVEYAQTNNLSTVNFTDEAKSKISSFYWTHNISELKSVIESTLKNSTDSTIDVSAIEIGEKKAESVSNEIDEDGMRLMSLKEAERLLIKKALIHTSENRTQAAKILGVSIRTLRNKINEYRGEGNNYFVNLR